MSIMRGRGTVHYGTPCTECRSAVVYQAATYARDFGCVYSTEGIKGFMQTGLCEFCFDYQADASAMNKDVSWKP